MKQDKNDAKMAVDGRLEYIGNEMYDVDFTAQSLTLTQSSKRIEGQIKEVQEKSESKKMDIIQLQSQGQQQPQSA